MGKQGDRGSLIIASDLVCTLTLAATLLVASSPGLAARLGDTSLPSRPCVPADHAGCVAPDVAPVAVQDSAIAGDDYPSAWKLQPKDAFTTVFGDNRECVSFVGWRIYRDAGGRKVPTDRNPPSDWATYSINIDGGWGNAGNWSAYAAAHGVRKDQHPTVGSVAQWDVHTAIGMKVGHVAMVQAVHGDGSIDIEQYNLRDDGRYSVLHMAKGSSAVDQSNGHGPWTLPWPDNFIHIHGR